MKKGRLLCLIICFVALCTYLFITFYNAAEKSAIRQLNKEQQLHAQQASLGIEDFFQTWTGILNLFANMGGIISLDEEGKRAMTSFYEAYQEQIRAITRVNERGRIEYTAPYSGSEGNDISAQKHVLEIIANHKTVVNDVFRTVQGVDGVALHVPVFKGTTFKGTIAIVLNFATLAKRYLEGIKIGKTGYAWLVSRDGTMLYSPVSGSIGTSIFEICRDYPEILAMTKEMLQGRQGTATYTFNELGDKTVAPIKYYSVYMPIHIGNNFWSIVVTSSVDEVLSSLASFRNHLFWVIFTILLGGVCFSILGTKAWLIIAEEKKRCMIEEELRRSEQYNRLLFELSPTGLALCRMDGALVDINPAYAGIIGRSVEETLQLTYWDITPQTYAEQEQAQLESLEKKGKYGPYEKEYIHKDGHLVPVRLQGRIIEKDRKKFIWSSIEDITQRKQAEEVLRESEDNLRLAGEIAHVGYWSRDLASNEITWSAETCRMFGLEPQTRKFNLSCLPDYIHPEDRHLVTRAIQDVVAGIRSYDLEYRIVRPDGKMRWVYSKGEVDLAEDGQSGRMFGSVLDITERKQAEEQLKAINEELSALNRIISATTTANTTGVQGILESVLDEALAITGLEGGTICLLTEDGRLHLTAHRATSEATIQDLTTNIVKIGDCLCGECAREKKPLILKNREAVLQFATREATRGEDIRFHGAFPLVAAEKCLGVLCIFTKTNMKPESRSLTLLETVSAQIALAIENAQLYETTFQYAATLEARVKERTEAIARNQKALMNVVEDLNKKSAALTAANKKLQELDRLKSMFIASMSHELRTPLNSIIGFSSILKEEWLGPVNDEQKENLSDILDSGRHLLSLINDVIDLSKVEAGMLETVRKPFRLRTLIREAVKAVEKEAEGKNIVVSVDADDLEILSDRRRLLQCLLNLLSNATKFTEQGKIEITAHTIPGDKGQQLVEIQVRDTGIGIRGDDIDKLFQPFVRLHAPGDGQFPGTGLGLYLTAKLTREVLGGEISIDSEFGKGSVFSLRVPMAISNSEITNS